MKKLPKDVDGRNGERAKWAQEALWAYNNGRPPFCVDRAVKAWQAITKSDDEDVLTDLLCDLRHWCDRNEVNFRDQVRSEKNDKEPGHDIAAFLRELRWWGKSKGFSYAEGLRKVGYHYDAETGKIPY